MRIRKIIGIQTLAVCAGFLLLGFSTGGSWYQLQRQQQITGADSIVIQDLRLMEESIKSWLISNDLIFGSGQTYLVDGAIRQSVNTIALASGIAESRLAKSNIENLQNLVTLMRQNLATLESMQNVPVDNAVVDVNELLNNWDELSPQVIEQLESTKQSIRQAALNNSAALDRYYELFLYHAVAGHLLVILLIFVMWRWVTHSLVTPLSALTDAADRSLARDEAFEMQHAGPTEIKQLANSIGSFVQSLENRVTERTKELENHRQQLLREVGRREQAEREANRSAERAVAASEAKSKFLANMSHEIRTPLNGILGTTELLIKDDLSDQLKSGLKTIKNSGNHLLDLINSVLDFSKMEVGGIELTEIEFSTDQLLLDIRSIFASQSKDSGIDFVFDVDPSLPEYLYGDRLRVKQIITNLLGNAFKFTEKGQVKLAVHVLESSQSRVQLLWQVHDTGIGIPKDRQGDIFRAFQQVDEGSTRQYGGTGLGLTISKQFAEQMNGGLTVESTPNVGTVFSCTMELGSDFELSGSDNSLPPGTALVVTENSQLVGVLRRCLASRNWNTEVVDPAANLNQSASYHAVIVDGASITKYPDTIRKFYCKDALLIAVQDQLSDPKSSALPSQFDNAICLPLIPNELFNALRSSHQAEVENRAHQADQLLTDVRVLVAEDNSVNQLVVEGMLGSLGIEVTMASNGKEVLERFHKDSYDLILMDWQMPIMDGIQATEAIREVEKQRALSPTPIIALTANSDPSNMRACRKAGMNDFMAKPFSLDELSRKIKQQVLVPDTTF